MARRNPHSTLRTPQFKRLVALLLYWFSEHARDLPWRRTRDPYAIWVSEIMLQQTQVKTVMPYWKRWMRELPTVEAVAKASPNKIHKLWEGLGYYTRARNLQKAAQQIVARPGGRFPENFDDVLELPGIGRYTAGAICSIAFNQPTPILDGNVIRVLTRIFGIGENPKEKKTNERLWRLAEQLVAFADGTGLRRAQIKKNLGSRDSRPTKNTNYSHLNQSLMELGALICTPRNPQCGICPAKRLCAAFRKNRVNELPNLDKRAAATARHFVAFVVERNGEFLIRQRPAGVVNAHLWEFPNVEILNGNLNPQFALKNTLGIEHSEIKPFHTIKHSITRYRIKLETFLVHLGRMNSMSPQSKSIKSGAHGTRPSETCVWLTPAGMRRLAFSSAHKKILAHLHSSNFSGATPETTRGTRVLPQKTRQFGG